MRITFLAIVDKVEEVHQVESFLSPQGNKGPLDHLIAKSFFFDGKRAITRLILSIFEIQGNWPGHPIGV